MENKHIQNNRNENTDKNILTKNTEEKHIHKNEYIKNENNFHAKGHIHDDVYMDEHIKEYVGQQTYEHSNSHTHVDANGNVYTHTNTHADANGNVYTHTHTHVDANGNVHTHTHTHSPETVKNELNRIARIIGHMKSIKIMIESGRDCSEVLIQLAAVDAAIKSLSRVILKEHMSTCIVDAIKTGDEEAIKALNEAIDKFMK